MYTKFAKKKIESMQLRERINYGYKKVIMLMIISGVFSIIAIGMLFASVINYVGKINASDIAVKMCRVDINAAARNVREMALNDDTSSYDGYEKTIAKLLDDVDSQLEIIKNKGVVSDEKYTEYATALSDWRKISSSILEEIRSGNQQQGVEDILNKCTPALNKLVNIALDLDEITDVVKGQKSHLHRQRLRSCHGISRPSRGIHPHRERLRFEGRIIYSPICCPTTYPVVQAACRLKPPVMASMSSTSPAKKR